MGLPEVSAMLWHERELLELLLFKLETEQLLLASANTRWLPSATREVEVVIDQIRQAELHRAVLVEGITEELGLPEGPTLAMLVDAAPEPWADILTEHRRAFLTLSQEITDAARTNREVMLIGQRSAREAMLSLADSVSIYDNAGKATGAEHAAPARLVDRAL